MSFREKAKELSLEDFSKLVCREAELCESPDSFIVDVLVGFVFSLCKHFGFLDEETNGVDLNKILYITTSFVRKLWCFPDQMEVVILTGEEAIRYENSNKETE